MITFQKNIRFLLIIGLSFVPLIPRIGSAQEEFNFIPGEPVYQYNDKIRFNALILSPDPIQEVLLFIQLGNEADIHVHPASIDSHGQVSLNLDLKQLSLKVFSNVEYWYQINLPNGDTYTSPSYSFFYDDNRYQWKTLESAPFKIHWYTGDITFAEEVLNVSRTGLKRLREFLDVFIPENVDIYVYESPQAVQEALPKLGQDWAAGHADPDRALILVSLPTGPDQHLEMERQIPHELMHIALYYTDSHAYSNLPTWFNEGLASLVELYPNPEYQDLLENAYDSGDLIPISSLCQVFPSGSESALLAYAESASFTRFLYGRFGNDGLNRLMAAYASEMECTQGIEEALGSDLTQLEASWLRTSFTVISWTKTINDFLPWVILLLVILTGPIILTVAIIRRQTKRMDL